VIYIVCGFHRSGTSMMMRCLQSAGVPVCGEHDREGLNRFCGRDGYEPNPNGFWHHWCRWSKDWGSRHEGMAVKVGFAEVVHLPLDARYRVVLMKRNPEEIRDSWARMWSRDAGRAKEVERVLGNYGGELDRVRSVLLKRKSSIVEMDYAAVVRQPQVELGRLWELKVPASCVDPSLHRERL